jgi:hypothetical protein
MAANSFHSARSVQAIHPCARGIQHPGLAAAGAPRARAPTVMPPESIRDGRASRDRQIARD